MSKLALAASRRVWLGCILAASRSFDKNSWQALKIAHGFDEEFGEHGFDFLGHYFAINTSEIEEQNHSIFREQFREFKREFKSLHL